MLSQQATLMLLCCCRNAEGGQELVLTLSGPECSDYLNFVIKDESAGRWYILAT